MKEHRPRALGLYTDFYELRMLESYLRLGMLEPATFSLFSRPSAERPWLLVAGLQTALELLDDFCYQPEDLEYLEAQGISRRALDWLESLELEGEIWAVEEGTVVLGDEPLLELTAPLPMAQLLEGALMNAMHLETLVASKAARTVQVAQGRRLVDFGMRRAHGLQASHRAARASYLAGFDATSNVAAGYQYDIPISGTMAHSFIQAFADEAQSFREFALDHPGGTVLLVDTYDTLQGVDRAIEIIRELSGKARVRALRLDSEPLEKLARNTRGKLDRAGLEDVQIVCSGGIDEWRVDAMLRDDCPVDGFGIGSALVTSSDAPALDVAYKLVEYADEGRAKYSEGKETLPGRKQVFRRHGADSDVLESREAHAAGEPLLRPVWRNGDRLVSLSLERARSRAQEQLDLVPQSWRGAVTLGEAPRPTIGPELSRLADATRARMLR